MEENIVRSEKDALAFVEKHGLVTLFPIRNTRFPSLYSVAAGENREEKFEKAWAWADNLAQQKKIYYGKLVGKQVTLVSLEIFPFIFKIYSKKERLDETAKRILEFLTLKGAASTTNLRKELKLMEKEHKSKFVKGLEELQLNLAIAIVSREKSPKMTYTWDLLERWMPKELLKKAESLTETLAKERIITKMFESRVVSKPEDLKKILP